MFQCMELYLHEYSIAYGRELKLNGQNVLFICSVF